jgi:2-keto-4-pentenoate hydratase/2-oxohepta-3-ene-1,7-dioic acid hydratase in catechol pathway
LPSGIPFALATVATEDGDRAAMIVAGHCYRLDRADAGLPAAGVVALLERWDASMATLQHLAGRLANEGEGCAAYVATPRLLAPIRFPAKLICVGAAYSDHLAQMALPVEKWNPMPMFLRPPTTSIVGPGRTVRIPRMTRQFDWEIELAVVIGRRLNHGDEARARDCIAGYSVGVDFTCRDLLNRGSPAGVDLVRAKAQDTMAPMGPVLMPASFVPDPQQLALRLWVNRELRQSSTTANMLYPVYEQVAVISEFITLEPGDVIFTGSPAGSARSEDEFLKGGDLVRADIESIGVLEVECIDERSGRGPDTAAIT